MATAINPVTGEITIQQADMTLLQASPEIRGLDVDALRLELRDLESNRWAPKTHNHSTTLTLVGTTYQRKLEFLDPYFFTFTGSGYTVQLSNGDNNIDEKTPGVNVSMRSANSAGSVVVETGVSGLTPSESAELAKISDIDIRTALMEQIARNESYTDSVTGDLVILNDAGDAELYRIPIWENVAKTTPYNGTAINRRERIE